VKSLVFIIVGSVFIFGVISVRITEVSNFWVHIGLSIPAIIMLAIGIILGNKEVKENNNDN